MIKQLCYRAFTNRSGASIIEFLTVISLFTVFILAINPVVFQQNIQLTHKVTQQNQAIRSFFYTLNHLVYHCNLLEISSQQSKFDCINGPVDLYVSDSTLMYQSGNLPSEPILKNIVSDEDMNGSLLIQGLNTDFKQTSVVSDIAYLHVKVATHYLSNPVLFQTGFLVPKDSLDVQF